MSIILIIIIVLVFISFGVVLYGLYDNSKFIKEYAKKHTIEEIDRIISEEQKLIESGSFKGIMLEDMLDRVEQWEMIKKYKLTGKL